MTNEEEHPKPVVLATRVLATIDAGVIEEVRLPGFPFPVFFDVLEDGIPRPYVERVIAAAVALSPAIIVTLKEATLHYCEWVCSLHPSEAVPMSATVTSDEIFEYVSGGSIGIQSPQGTGVVIRFELNCAWDSEHGLEWLIRDDVVLYVGPFVMRYEWGELVSYQNDDPGNFANR
jgi:hypothetical protein